MEKVIVLATSNGIGLCTFQSGKWRLSHRSLERLQITSVVTQAGRIIAGTRNGIQISVDRGINWQAAGSDPSIPHIRWIFASPGSESLLLAGTEPAGIFVSHDGGDSWTTCPEIIHMRDRHKWFLPYSPEAGCVRGFAQHSNRFYAAVEVGGVLVSDDYGQTWVLAEGSRGDPYSAPARYIHPDVHSITVHPSSLGLVFAPTGGGFFRSMDGGKSWSALYRCYCRASWVDPEDPQHIILGPADSVDRNGRIESTYDGGRTWQAMRNGLPASWSNHMVERFTQIDNELFAVLSNGDLLAAQLKSFAWQQILSDAGSVNSIAELVF